MFLTLFFKSNAKEPESFEPIIHLVGKNFRKTNFSYPLISTLSCAYQGVRNVRFSGKFAHVLNE